MSNQHPGAVDDRIGPYRVVTTIGVGGMGQVLKVQDTRSGRYFALKIHYAPIDKEAVQLNYRREHRAMSRCDHPNVIRSYDSGVHEGCPYLVMEFVDGVSLTDFLEERNLDPGPERDKMAALLGIQIASALDHIHSRHLVHLDLKPANILVTPDERVKLIDFGIARELDADRPAQGPDGVGTFAFCSPEQVTGAPCDHRSDLYSFGVVLYLLLTGELPFVAEEAIAYILKHVNDPPVPLETYYPDVPAPLRDIVLKLLAKDPMARPQSGREVEGVLKAFVEEVWRREGLAAPRVVPTETPRTVRLFEPAFVGREYARKRLAGSISLLQAGVGGIDVVLGEPGIGKGQLVNDALSGARARGLVVFSSRCYPGGGGPYHGMVELLEAIVNHLLRREVNLVQVELGNHLPILARAFPPVARLLPAHFPEVRDASPHVERERLRDALMAFLDAVLTSPTVLALRDLQWADPATIDLLEAVALRHPDPNHAPVLVVASVSSEDSEKNHVLQRWGLEGPILIESLQVQPFDRSEVDRLVDSMLGGHIDLGRVGTVLHEETRGNPLHVVEAIRMMVDRGDLSPHSVAGDEVSGWTLLVPDESDTVAEMASAFRNAFLERVALLPEPTRRMLDHMAVLGRPCPYPWLRVVTPVAEDELLDILDRVMARRILVEIPGERRGLFAFYHPWMARVLLGQLERDQAEQLHRAAADAWMTVHGDQEDGSLEMTALHLFEGRAWDRAAPRLLKAAEARLRLGLHDTCAPLLEKALEAARRAPGVEPEVAARAHLRLGQVLREQGAGEKASSHLRTAASRAGDQGALDVQGEALFTLAELAAQRGDYRTASVQYGEAAKVQRRSGARDALVRTTADMALSMCYLGECEPARKLFADALTEANKLNDPGLSSRAVHGLGLIAFHEGRLRQAARHFVEAANLSRSWGHDTFHLVCQGDEALVHAATGDLVSALSLASNTVLALRQVGHQPDVAAAAVATAAVALELRDLDRAEKMLDQVAELLKRRPHQHVRCVRQLLMGQLALARGKPKMALVAFGEALEQADAGHYRALQARAQRFSGSALIHAGSLRNGILTIRRGVAAAEKLGDVPGMLEADLFLAEGLVVRGERDEAWSVLADIRPRLKSVGLRLLLLRALALSARLASMNRKPSRVRSHVDEAFKLIHEIRRDMSSAMCARFDSRPEVRLLVSLRRG